MAIVEMNKITLIGLGSDKELIMESLMQLGAVELIDRGEMLASDEWSRLMKKDGDAEAVSELDGKVEKTGAAIEYLEKYDTGKKPLFEYKKAIRKKEFEEITAGRNRLESVAEQILSLGERLSVLKSDKNRNTNLIGSLEPWKSLDVPLDLSATKYSAVITGVVPAETDIDELKQELPEQAAESYMEVVSQDHDQFYLFLVYHKGLEEDVIKVLKKYAFSKTSFKDLKGTANENIERLLKETAVIDSGCKETESRIADYASEKGRLEVLYDYFVMQRDRKRAQDHILKTDKVFMLDGWIPRDLSRSVKEGMETKWECIIDIREPGKDEEFPVLLANRGLSEAVESVTEMYSLPSPREIDPNIIMAPFFVLFFGLMLSDGGYGLVMAALAGFVLWRIKLDESMRKFMKLMFYCGLSTVFWGALFGGWFGIAALGEYPIWFNPVKDPEEMLRWALLFGIIHIYTGIGVRAVNLLRHKKYLDVVFDVLTWYVFFTGFTLFVLPYAPKMEAESVSGLVNIGKYLLVIGAVLLILTQGRNNKGLFMKFIGGISSLYDLIGFMSDVLSYSRLLALGLATSVIASIVNQMGAMGGLDNIFKIIGFILVVLIGHTFNFAINALGAYVHSSRLQYIEFFGKFYKGGGTAFQPLKANTKYINLKN